MTSELEIEARALVRYTGELKKANQGLKSKLERTIDQNLKLTEQRHKIIAQRDKAREDRSKLIAQRDKELDYKNEN